MGKIFEIATIHAFCFKTAIEGSNAILDDTIITIVRDDEMNKKEKNIVYTEKEDDEAEEEKPVKKSKKKSKKAVEEEVIPKKKPSDEEDDEEKPNGKMKKKLNKKNHFVEEQKDEEETEKPKKNKKQEREEKESQKGFMKIMAVNSGVSMFIQVKLQAEKFDVFKCKPASYNFGVRLAELFKLLKPISNGSDELLTLYIDEDDVQHLTIRRDNLKKGRYTINNLKLVDVDEKPYEFPKHTVDVAVRMSAGEFHTICRDKHNIAEYVEIRCTQDNISFTSKGDCSDSSDVIKTGDENGVAITMARDEDGEPKCPIVQGIYELKNISQCAKYASISSEMHIRMKNDHLLCIRYTISALGSVLVLLTPIDEAHLNNNFADEDDVYEKNNNIKLKEEN